MMVNELKKRNDYEFECNISDELKNETNCDLWGSAFIFVGDAIGVEYNFCIDKGTNSSAIYEMTLNYKTGYMETDYDKFIHYEVDFNDLDWEKKLENAMCKAFWKLHCDM